MTLATIFRAVFVWCLIVPLAIANGIVREFVLLPAVGPVIALPLSGILLSLLILLLTWICLPLFGQRSAHQLMMIGIGWGLLTVTFEFGFGHFVSGKPWGQLLAAYDIRTGNLWLLVLGITVLAPWLTAKMRRRI